MKEMTNPGSSGAGVYFLLCGLQLQSNRAANYRFAYFSHFMISGSVGRLPYIRMPMR